MSGDAELMDLVFNSWQDIHFTGRNRQIGRVLTALSRLQAGAAHVPRSSLESVLDPSRYEWLSGQC